MVQVKFDDWGGGGKPPNRLVVAADIDGGRGGGGGKPPNRLAVPAGIDGGRGGGGGGIPNENGVIDCIDCRGCGARNPPNGITGVEAAVMVENNPDEWGGGGGGGGPPNENNVGCFICVVAVVVAPNGVTVVVGCRSMFPVCWSVLVERTDSTEGLDVRSGRDFLRERVLKKCVWEAKSCGVSIACNNSPRSSTLSSAVLIDFS